MNYFFDSSSIIELINLNGKYEKFKGEIIVTNALNLAEVHYYFLKTFNKQTADYWVRHLNFHFLEITPEICIDASNYRFENKKNNLSYADCIGYISAIKNKLKFLTGDEKFKGKEDVEYIS